MEELLGTLINAKNYGAIAVNLDDVIDAINGRFIPLEKEQHRCIWRAGKFNRKANLNEEKNVH